MRNNNAYKRRAAAIEHTEFAVFFNFSSNFDLRTDMMYEGIAKPNADKQPNTISLLDVFKIFMANRTTVKSKEEISERCKHVASVAYNSDGSAFVLIK